MHLEPFNKIFETSSLACRPFSTYQMGASRFKARLRLLPHVPTDVNAEQLWLQLLPKEKRLYGNHSLGHSDFFSAICAWFVARIR